MFMKCIFHKNQKWLSQRTQTGFNTVVGDNINIMKTTFEFNFNFYQAFKQFGYTKIWKQREAANIKSFTLNTCKLVIRKKAC